MVQAFWKLKPPVTPSTSSTSPAKWMPGQSRLSIVLKSTSDSFTPPQVTNSSLKVLLPSTAKRPSTSCATSACNVALVTCAHGVVAGMPAATTSFSQRRWGRGSGLKVPTCLRASAWRRCVIWARIASRLAPGTQLIATSQR